MSRIEAERAKEIIRDAGGRVVGRTRLQKLAYLITEAGLDNTFRFAYKHYGPYSDELAIASREAQLLGLLNETEMTASWGGVYSIFTVIDPIPAEVPQPRRQLAALAVNAGAVELELAATALLLAKEGFNQPWEEVRLRKPEKADAPRLEGARQLFQQLRAVDTPVSFPNI